jgi:hypothetical protein
MRLPSSWSCFPALLLMLSALPAQVNMGDIALIDAFPASSTTFHVLRGNTLTAYVTPGFQGNGIALCVLWDPLHPNDFLIGGFGFVCRATITGPGTCNYVRLTNSVTWVQKMDWDTHGGVILFDVPQLRWLDPASGAVVDLTTAGTQPGGMGDVGAVNPATGDVVLGDGNGSLYRFQRASTVITRSTNHAPNAPAVVILGLTNIAQGSTPLPFLLDPMLGTSGCRLYTSMDATVAALTAGGPAANMSFPLSITTAFAGHRFFVQHACFEPVAGGMSWSNGLAVRIP